MDILIIIFAGLVCASTGQVFWKYGMNQIGQIDAVNINILIGMLFNPYVLAGIILYATSTLFWLIALSKKDLSFVYPFISLTFLMVLLLSYFVLKEQINLTRVVGTIIIITGLLVIVRN